MNMIQHHIKLAIRNLLKYKAQSLISIIGLAVGVCCFAICSYTLRVDLNWNHNIKEVERICIVFTETEKGSQTSYSPFASAMLAKEFPEIESATAYSQVQPYTEKLCEIRKTDGTTNGSKTSGSDSVKTGDPASVLGWLGLAVSSLGAGMGGFAWKRRKRK